MVRDTFGSGGFENDTAETINREQQDWGQAQEVAEEARRTGPGRTDSVRGGPANPAQILPDDVPDLVETMNGMVRSGRIDAGAYAGEPMHDDEEGLLGDTEAEADDPLEALHETGGADGLALLEVEDRGGDPLGSAASERGMADPDEELDEDVDDEELDDDLDDDELDDEDVEDADEEVRIDDLDEADLDDEGLDDEELEVEDEDGMRRGL